MIPMPINDARRDNSHRAVFCRHYLECLGVAARKGWNGFSCIACPLAGRANVRPEAETTRRAERLDDEEQAA